MQLYEKEACKKKESSSETPETSNVPDNDEIESNATFISWPSLAASGENHEEHPVKDAINNPQTAIIPIFRSMISTLSLLKNHFHSYTRVLYHKFDKKQIEIDKPAKLVIMGSETLSFTKKH